jgi:hypothetical protein
MGATLFSRWRHTSRPAHKTPRSAAPEQELHQRNSRNVSPRQTFSVFRRCP